jgi:hypothetical protein
LRIASTRIEDAQAGDVIEGRREISALARERGRESLAQGEVAVVTLAAGAGSRWTQGPVSSKDSIPSAVWAVAGVRFLIFIWQRLRAAGQRYGIAPLHVVTSGYLTDAPLRTRSHG